MSAKLNNSQQNSNKNLKKGSKKPTIEELMPRLDDGTLDYEGLKERLSQNFDVAKVVFGALPPQALELEEAVLGACLIDIEGFAKAHDVLAGFINPFYKDAHNAIWEAMSNLSKDIDALTVFQELERIKKTNTIGGNPYFLIQLTEGVSSSAHIESHARLILQTHLRRKILTLGINLVTNSYDKSVDLFEMVDEHSFNISKLIEFNTTLKGHGMDKVMEMAKNATTKEFLIGSLIKVEDVAILFSGPENGKSVFSIQMSDAISRGNSLFSGLLRNECAPKKVLYFDFELTLSDFKNRYIDGAGNVYPFLDENWFVRVGNDEDSPQSFSEIAANMQKILIRNIQLHQPAVVVIDNITAMSNGSTADAEVVKVIMDLLMQLKKKYKLTVIVLAHTPKIYDMSKPIVIANLAGSSLLAAYADSIIGIGQSKMGNNVKYIKAIKVRSGVKIHDDQNVIQVAIEKEGAFLQYKVLEEPTGRETDHLVNREEKPIDEDIITQMVSLKREGKSLQFIVDELGLSITRQYVGQLIKTYLAKHHEIKASIEESDAFAQELAMPSLIRSDGDAPF